MTGLGNRIREARESKGLTQLELSAEIEVAQSVVCNYERGKKTPTLNTFAKIADALEVTSDWLLGRED